MRGFFVAAMLVRWLDLTALALVIGALVLDALVLPAGAAQLAGARRRLRLWTIAGLLVLAAATLGDLLVRAHTMAQGSVGASLTVVPAVLARTHFGAIWTVRAVLVALALLVSLPRARAWRVPGLLLLMAIALTTSLTGHAADWGDVTLAVAVDWAHVVVGAAWTGGLIGLAAVILVERAAWPGALIGAVARRFSRLAGVCLAVVLLTGGYNAWTQLGDWRSLWTTPYGRALTLKLLAVAALAFLGAVNRYTVIPRLEAGRRARGVGVRLFRLVRLVARGPSPARPARLSTYVAWEALLAILVFACTAFLGESTPGRHAHHMAHTDPRGPFRVTMAELHARGGVPPGWVFRPPAGDAGRGRAVFIELGCFACHAVQGESFPAPTRPGPELTGIGHHLPPGYLAESVLNPNAVIVAGPGYTTADGLSIMPDYRREMSVAELDDLVAYLQSLE